MICNEAFAEIRQSKTVMRRRVELVRDYGGLLGSVRADITIAHEVFER